jgi:hypothetical protein
VSNWIWWFLLMDDIIHQLFVRNFSCPMTWVIYHQKLVSKFFYYKIFVQIIQSINGVRSSCIFLPITCRQLQIHHSGHLNMQPTLSPKVDRIAWIWTHRWGKFVCICRSSMTLTSQTCQLAILLRLGITSSCSSQENVAPPCTHWHATTMFGVLNNPHYTNNTCEAIHLVMVLT